MDKLPESPVLKFHPNTLENVRGIFDLDKNKLNQSIDLLEDWVKKQNHFVMKKDISRDYFERKIIASKGSVEKAKSSIDKLCTLKTLLPKFFICEDLKEKTENSYEAVCNFHLPVMTKDFQRIYMVKMYGTKFTSDTFMEFYRFGTLVAEYALSHDYPQAFIFLFDMSDVNLTTLLHRMNLVELQQIATIIIEGYGARLSAIHIVNNSKVIDMFVKVIKQVLPEKISHRVHAHLTLDSLYKCIDKDLLPSDMGGKQKSVREIQAEWIELITSESHRKYLQEMVQMRTDESLRLTEKFNEECIGLPGSFRTLTVD